MSTAYHSQSDGQMERIDQVIESYPRSYCSYEQNDWSFILAMAESAYNNSKHTATKISLFYANYGFEPRTNWPTEIQCQNQASELYGHYRTSLHSKLSKQLEQWIEAMRKYYDRKRQSIELFKKGQLVILNGKNICPKHRCKKLENKMYGPFEVKEMGKNWTYCKLPLLDSWKIHSTFNICLLERYPGIDPKKQVLEIEADDAGWKRESIIASGPSDEDPPKHVYLINWKGYSHDENTWETYENVFKSSMDFLKEYYSKNPAIEKEWRYGKKKR